MSDKPSPSIKKKDQEDDDNGKEKWVPKNWDSFKKDERALKKMPPVLRSRYLAYEDPPKEVADAKSSTMKRLTDKKNQNMRNVAGNEDEMAEREHHEKLIGQLKAAEARNRIRIMRLRYEANMGQEVNHLIACQPTARKAVRLQALLPSRPDDHSGGDKLDKLSRARVEALLDDGQGILTGRT